MNLFNTTDPGYFWINLYLGDCRIAHKMYWIHSLVGVSHFAKSRKHRPVTV